MSHEFKVINLTVKFCRTLPVSVVEGSSCSAKGEEKRKILQRIHNM